MYRSAKDRDAGREELRRLEEIGKHLVLALDLASGEPGSVGQRASWGHAERALADLGRLVGEFEQARPIVQAAASAVTGRKVWRGKREDPWR